MQALPLNPDPYLHNEGSKIVEEFVTGVEFVDDANVMDKVVFVVKERADVTDVDDDLEVDVVVIKDWKGEVDVAVDVIEAVTEEKDDVEVVDEKLVEEYVEKKEIVVVDVVVEDVV